MIVQVLLDSALVARKDRLLLAYSVGRSAHRDGADIDATNRLMAHMMRVSFDEAMSFLTVVRSTPNYPNTLYSIDV